jgi:hypothetical protein
VSAISPNPLRHSHNVAHFYVLKIMNNRSSVRKNQKHVCRLTHIAGLTCTTGRQAINVRQIKNATITQRCNTYLAPKMISSRTLLQRLSTYGRIQRKRCFASDSAEKVARSDDASQSSSMQVCLEIFSNITSLLDPGTDHHRRTCVQDRHVDECHREDCRIDEQETTARAEQSTAIAEETHQRTFRQHVSRLARESVGWDFCSIARTYAPFMCAAVRSSPCTTTFRRWYRCMTISIRYLFPPITCHDVRPTPTISINNNCSAHTPVLDECDTKSYFPKVSFFSGSSLFH